MEGRVALSGRKEDRLHVVHMSLEGRIRVAEAADLLDLYRHQILRLRRRVAADARQGSVQHGDNRGHPPANRTAEAVPLVAPYTSRHTHLDKLTLPILH